jgi:hypothetical protein
MTVAQHFIATLRGTSAIFVADAAILDSTTSERALREGIAILEERIRQLRGFPTSMPAGPSSPRKSDYEIIGQIVAEAFGIPPEQLYNLNRRVRYTFPRQVAMYLMRETTSRSATEIARHYGLRDHTTVLYAEREVPRKALNMPETFPTSLGKLVEAARAALGSDRVGQKVRSHLRVVV